MINPPIDDSTSNGHKSQEDSDPYFNLFTIDDVASWPPKKWLIDDILGEGDLLMIYGPSGSGKTFIALNMMMALARGRGRFAGGFDINRPVNVVYMTAEGRSGLRDRVMSAVKSFELNREEEGRCRISTKVMQFVDMQIPGYYQRFLNELDEQGFSPDVIVIDHLSTTIPGKGDSDQAAATLVAAAIANIQDQLGCAIVVIHHTGYDTSHSRGMTNYKDILDSQIKVAGDENPRVMNCDKLKDGLRWQGRQFYIMPVNGTESCTVEWGGAVQDDSDVVNDQLDNIESYISENPGLTRNGLRDALDSEFGYGDHMVRDRIKRLRQANRIRIEKGSNNASLHYIQ